MNYTSELGGVMNEFPFSIESRVEKEKKDKKKTYTVLVLSYLKVCTKEKMEFSLLPEIGLV